MKMLSLMSRVLVTIVVSVVVVASAFAQEEPQAKLPVAGCIVGMQRATGCKTAAGKPGLQKEQCSSKRNWMPVGACVPMIDPKPPLRQCAPGTTRWAACMKDGEVGVGKEVCTDTGIWFFEGCTVLVAPKPPMQ